MRSEPRISIPAGRLGVEIPLSSLPSVAAVAYDDRWVWAPSCTVTDSSARALGHDKFLGCLAQARVATDPDLAPLRGEVAAKLQTKLKQCVEMDLAAARSAAALGNAVMAFARCETLTSLAAHLSEPDRGRLQDEASEIVVGLVDRQGVLLDPPHGHLLTGAMARYNARMMSALVKGLNAKGYLPQPDESPWRDRWSRAPYRFNLEVNERQERNYLASENRLTRIDTHLKLFYRGMEIWQATPTARTAVPLPGLPGYFSARVALSSARIEEFERLLHDNARSQIDEKFAFALSHLPKCG